LSHHSSSHSKQHHFRRSRHLHRLPRVKNGTILHRPSTFQNRDFNSPIARAYARGIGVSPIMKNLEEKALKEVPQHSHSSRSYHFNNPNPWFLYGKSKEFRQLGLIPSFPNTTHK
jgi:hypothetical protein